MTFVIKPLNYPHYPVNHGDRENLECLCKKSNLDGFWSTFGQSGRAKEALEPTGASSFIIANYQPHGILFHLTILLNKHRIGKKKNIKA